MKIADKKPESIKSPVRVTQDTYEMYYAKPLNLGTIKKKGTFWFTEDGKKFLSSRDALEYLVKIWEAGIPKDIEEIHVDDRTRERVARDIMRRRPTKKNYPKLGPKVVEAESVEYTPEHPLFKEFVKFMESRQIKE